ncbi:MAG: hypothetical protein JO223_04225 [Hyphomicrobiales bacterium]|nr:hypothetical protein [Hyphomicrobiales bacterium]
MPAVGRRHNGGLALCCLALALPWLTAHGVLPAYGSDWSTCKYFSQLPDDCAGAEQRKYDNLRNYRYEEIELFAKDALKKILYVSVYNTTGQNDADETRDSAPKPLSDRLDPKRIARQYQALAVAASPPRYWTVDWLADRVGAVRNFDGLDAAWMGNSLAPATRLSAKPVSAAYRTTLVARTAVEGFKRGAPVYLLDDPKGRTWVMISYTTKDDPSMTIDKLGALGDLLKPPQGWRIRTAVLGKDLILEPKGGYAALTQDDKGDVYSLTGPGQSNYVP